MKLSINKKLIGAKLLKLKENNSFVIFIHTNNGTYKQPLTIYPELLGDEVALLKILNKIIKKNEYIYN